MTTIPLQELLSLKGKTAIVTGGAMGIGEGIASRLAEAGANVVIADLDEAAATATAQGYTGKGWQAKAVHVDVADESSVAAMVAVTVEAYRSVDILVNNAGIYPAKPLTQMELSDFEQVINVNLKSVYLCTKAVSEQMIAQGHGGRIINVTSIDALHPSMIGLAHYDASKHGVWGFTKNTALELAEQKIWVNAIAPGGISTPGVAKMQGTAVNEDAIKAFMEKIPMHRFGESDDIGKVALFLASDMSSYMTGAQIVVDGGVLLR
ncbi:MAG: SDR family NAD(P)-dependent oxidoreductase [Patescibacteria group bacterium]